MSNSKRALQASGGIGCALIIGAIVLFAATISILGGAAQAMLSDPVGTLFGWLTSAGGPNHAPPNLDHGPSGITLYTVTPYPDACGVTPTPVFVTATADPQQPTPVPPNTAAPPASIALPTATPCPTPYNTLRTPHPGRIPPPGDGPHGSPLSYWTVTQHYGCTPLTFENWVSADVCPSLHYHTGTDLSTGCGAAIHTTIGGQVVIAGWNSGGFGQWVVVEGSDRAGNVYRVFFPHLATIDVSVGDSVNWGDVVGTEGTTGNSTGCHTHYMIYLNGTRIDSTAYLPWPAPGGDISEN